jgi:hypothetical protein
MSSGDSLLQWGAASNEPPATDYATLDVRNGHLVLDFDAATDESAVFSGVLPQHYGSGGVTVYLHWSASGVTTNAVVWTAAFERVGAGQQDIDEDGFATANSVTATAPGTDGFVDIASIAFTNGAQMDSVAVGEKFRIKVTRDADNGADTMAGDAELHAVEIRET